MDNIYQFIAIFFLLLFSAIFSGSETAFFSLDSTKKKKILAGKHKNSSTAKLILKPNYLLVTVLFGNMLVNIFLSNLVERYIQKADFLVKYSTNAKVFFSIAAATFILLIFGEAFPKVLAINKPNFIIRTFSPLIYFISIIFYPFKIALNYITRISKRIFTSSERHDTITDKELSAFVNVSFKEGVIDRDEVKLINNVIKFAQLDVSSIMTPRTGLFCLDVSLSFDKFIYEVKKAGHSKIPIYENNNDNIIGIVYMRDLLSYVRGDIEKPKDISTFTKEILYVPEGKSLIELLRDFKKKRLKSAVVIDEYGGTAGIVTLDDIIHRITGRFFEEDSKHEGRKVIKTRKHEFLCMGDTTLEEIERVTSIILECKDYETIGGYFMSKKDKVPKVGDILIEGRFTFEVKKMDNNKIEQIMIREKAKIKKNKNTKTKLNNNKKGNP